MSTSLEDFFRENQAQVRAQMDEDADAVYPELVFLRNGNEPPI